MASNTQDVQTKILELEIRYETAIRQLGKYRDEINKTKQVMKELKAAHSNGMMSTTEFQQSMAACEQQIRSNQQAISIITRQIQSQIRAEKEQEGSLNQLRSSLSKATAEYDAMSRAERESAAGKELKKKINDITAELKGAEEETSRFYRNVGNYQEAVNGLEKVEEKAKGLGKQFLAMVGITSIGALGKQIQDVGTAYADQMAKVQAVTNANTVEFAQMSAEVERLGSTTRYTAQEAAEAMEFLTRNGLDAVSATNTLAGVLKLAQANAIELGESADIVTGQMNAFHLKVSDVTRINDVLSYTCAHSATNILQLNEALRNTAPIAYTAGVSIEETAAALGTLANNNIKGADSGTILKQAFNGLITSTAKSKKAYADLGIEMNIATVQNDGLIASLKKIMDAGASVEQLSDIFGRRAVPGVLALMNSIDQLGDMYADVAERSAGATARMFEQSYSQFSVAAASLKSAWEGLLISIWGGTNEQLRQQFIDEADNLDKEWTRKMDSIKERLEFVRAAAERNPEDDVWKQQIEKLEGKLKDATRSYSEVKNELSDRMQVEMMGNDELAQQWTDAAEVLKNDYMPQIEELEARYQAAKDNVAANPEDESSQEEMLAAREALREATDEYTEAKDRLAIQLKAEATGDEELAARYLTTADAVDVARDKMNQLKAQMDAAKEAAQANPEDSQLYAIYEQKRSEFELATEVYNDARVEYESVQEEVNMASGSGLSGVMTNVLTELKDMVAWVKANINELGTLIMAVIAGITLTKLVNHVKTSAGQMKNDLITNAQAASQQVQNISTKEASLIRRQKQLQTQLDQASDQKRIMIEQKLQINKEQIRQTELAKQKAQLAEQQALQQAVAATTATGWKSAMMSATLAVKRFVTASKTAMKSFALTAILSLSIELIMKLWDTFNSGESVISKVGGSIKTFIQTALQKLGQVIVDVINYFIDMYNTSKFVRVSIALLGGVFKTVWTIIQAGAEGLVNIFRLLGDIIGTSANIMKNFLAGNWGEAIKGVKGYGVAIKNFFKAQVQTGIEAGKEIADGFVNSFKDMDKELEKVEWKPATSGTSSTNGYGGSSNGGGGRNGGGSTDEENASGSGGKGYGKTDSKKDKEAEARRQAEKKEQEAIAAYQNELYKILEDGAEKRRQAVEAEYNKRIDKLKTHLATEKNLTATAREAISKMIEVIEQEKADALLKLSKEERKKVLEEEIKNNEARLNLIRKGTGAELSAKLRGLDAEREAELKKANEEIADEEERQRKIAEITSTYEQKRLGLISGAMDTELGIRLANLDKKHEIAVQEAEDAIAIEQEKLDKLRAISQDEYDAMSEEQKAANDRQLQEATDALARRQEALTLINEQYVRDTTAAQEESEQQAVARQKQTLQDRILMMQNDEEERLQMLRNGHVITEEEELADQQRKLESIGGFEAQKLEMQAEYAQQTYDALLERGQLSTQTEEEFNREMEQARQNNLNAKKAIDDAYVEQEKAKYNSMRQVTSSLISLLDNLGESNKEFAMMSKVITLAQIAIDTGKAIAAGTAEAIKIGFPQNIAAIATTVATVIANMATAISTVKSAKLAQGGRVTGPGSGTSDSVPAMLSNGEFVMTAAATRIYEPLLVAMNNIGRGVPMQVINSNRDIYISESLTESFSAAVQDIQPVVSVTEINEVQSRVRTIENLDTF